MRKIKLWREANKEFVGFVIRFTLSFFVLSSIYKIYLNYSSEIDQLDSITYFISRGSFEAARILGVADCEWSCFYGGCFIGSESGRVNVISGCNGLILIILYIAYIIGFSGFSLSTLLHSIIGAFVITLFNITRIGLLILYVQSNSFEYFMHIKTVFTLFLYLSIIALWLLKPRIDSLFKLKAL